VPFCRLQRSCLFNRSYLIFREDAFAIRLCITTGIHRDYETKLGIHTKLIDYALLYPFLGYLAVFGFDGQKIKAVRQLFYFRKIKLMKACWQGLDGTL